MVYFYSQAFSEVFINELRFQNGTSKGRGGTIKLPYAFSEQEVSMLPCCAGNAYS
jgi:hypothetical protein